MDAITQIAPMGRMAGVVRMGRMVIGEFSKADLYERAQAAGVTGPSNMTKNPLKAGAALPNQVGMR